MCLSQYQAITSRTWWWQAEGMQRHEVTLLVRKDCHGCAAAQADIARICAELDVPWQLSDVDADPHLRAEYGDRVPVILLDGQEHSCWTVSERRLRAALSR
jgi:glutaredoxin